MRRKTVKKNKTAKHLFRVLVVSQMISVFGFQNVSAANNAALTTPTPGKESLVREVTYTTTKADYKAALDKTKFEEEISKDGKTYVRTNDDIQFEVINKTEKKVEKDATYTRKKSDLKEKNYDPEKEIKVTQEDGSIVTAKLTSVNYQSEIITEQQKVTSEVDYGYQVKEPKADKKRKVTVKNKNTGKNMEVTVKLDEIKKGKAKWVKDVTLPIVVNDYGKEFYVFENTLIECNENTPNLDSHKDLVLKHLGLSSKEYKINKITWDGAAYQNGTKLYRNAKATASRYVRTYVAKYSASVPVEKTVYTGVATYRGTVTENSGQVEYQVKAKATYMEKNIEQPIVPEENAAEEVKIEPTPTQQVKEKSVASVPEKKENKENDTGKVYIVVGTIAALLLISLLVIILYNIQKKKKGEENGQRENQNTAIAKES